MPTKRRKRIRDFRTRITAGAVDAYRANDWARLSRALGLKPWDMTACAVVHGHCVTDDDDQRARTETLRADLDAAETEVRYAD